LVGVYEEDPQSFKIEAFLLKTFSSDPDHVLSLIKPGPFGFGREIYHTLENIPRIGLTWQPTPSHTKRFGFLPEMKHAEDNNDQKEDDQNGPEFEPEALLVLDVDPRSLPPEITMAWVLQVKNRKNQAAYTEVAKAIMKKFRINVIVTAATMDNPDVEGEGVETKLGKKAVFNPVVIRTTKRVK